MVLRVLSKLTVNAVNEGLRVFKVPSKENFKIRVCDRSGAIIAALILSLSETDGSKKI